MYSPLLVLSLFKGTTHINLAMYLLPWPTTKIFRKKEEQIMSNNSHRGWSRKPHRGGIPIWCAWDIQTVHLNVHVELPKMCKYEEHTLTPLCTKLYVTDVRSPKSVSWQWCSRLMYQPTFIFNNINKILPELPVPHLLSNTEQPNNVHTLMNVPTNNVPPKAFNHSHLNKTIDGRKQWTMTPEKLAPLGGQFPVLNSSLIPA